MARTGMNWQGSAVLGWAFTSNAATYMRGCFGMRIRNNTLGAARNADGAFECESGLMACGRDSFVPDSSKGKRALAR